MNISGIYKIQSLIKPERIYIGSAININNRWSVHLYSLRKYKHNNPKLQNHYNKYGESDLQFTILLSCGKEDLIKIEQYFLDSYNPYFNCCKIAGSSYGLHWKLSNETKLKMSIYQRGKKRSNDTKEKLSIAWTKRRLTPVSKETRERMGNSHRGSKRTEETRQKMRDNHKTKKHRN